MPKSKLVVSLYVVVVFLSGVLVGGASYRLYSVTTVTGVHNRSNRSPEDFRRRYVEDMRGRMKLNDQQVTRLQQILDGTRDRFKQLRETTQPQYDAIQAGQVDQIRAMLDDPQKALYEQWRQEREKVRRQHGRKR
jgi:uncharacterized membrane protein